MAKNNSKKTLYISNIDLSLLVIKNVKHLANEEWEKSRSNAYKPKHK